MQVDFADPTLMETESFSGILFNIADVVSRHQDGASTRNDRGEELHDSVSSCRIEIPGRFVSQNHLRVIQQGTCNRQTLLFSAGELVRHLILLVLQIDHIQHLSDFASDLQLIFPAGCPQHETQIMKYAPIGQQLIILKHDTDPTTQIGNVLSANPSAPTSASP